MSDLIEIDALEAIVIIDNELDMMSAIAPGTVSVSGNFASLAMESQDYVKTGSSTTKELRMENFCCSAHGLSILITATKGDIKHSVLFDAGPEEDAWERNARRLGVDLSSVELIQLSHWHRDHSGGMLRAINMVNDAKKAKGMVHNTIVDLHPSRPDFRGLMLPEGPVALPADPSFAEIEAAGGKVQKNSTNHTVLDNMFLISGEIPRVTPYETGLKFSVRFDNSTDTWEKDELITDERFIACNLKGKGIVMFTACSHAGVINACKHAMESIGHSIPMHAVIGGFHLVGGREPPVKETVQGFKELDTHILMPGHCSGWRVKYEIEKQMPGRLVPCTVGSKITF